MDGFRSSLVIAAQSRRGGESLRQLSRDHAAGRLVRVRRGVYVPTPLW